jgi:hypothetical protein
MGVVRQNFKKMLKKTCRAPAKSRNMALREFLPAKYIMQAEQLLRNGKGINGVNIEEIEDERVRQRQ